MDSVHIAELSWPVYDEKVKHGRTVVLLPIGALEQHGPHMSMNPDVLLPTAMAGRVARNIGALVAPAIAYGYKSQQKSGGGNHMPGTTSLDGLTLTSTIKDVLKEFARHGVRQVAMVNGHFENSMFIVEGVDLALRELRWEGIHDFKVVVLSYWDFVTEDTIRAIYPYGFPGWAVEHGGVLETSLMLHLHPQLVDMSKAVDQEPATFPPYDVFPTKPQWTPCSGCLSSAKPASAAKGKLLLEVCVEGISQQLRTAFD
ncbi:creatininase [Azohydromonas lata]|uniref:Creatininase n=1 Tax=Azohydromonas lata TaxID=45677 RepID=A0ABU5IB25_9BURK|nr:creatininase [Azohydromonas lata]MDZ5456314.1 creatininase [Azohydromonas lata]